jgi:hypothetical protein
MENIESIEGLTIAILVLFHARWLAIDSIKLPSNILHMRLRKSTGVTYEEREGLLELRNLLFSKRISLPSRISALMSIKPNITVPASNQAKKSRGQSPPFGGDRKYRTILDCACDR